MECLHNKENNLTFWTNINFFNSLCSLSCRISASSNDLQKHVRTEFFSKVCFYITFGFRCSQESFHLSSNEERRLRDCKFFSKVCFYITFGLRCAQDISHVCSNEERRLRDYNLFISTSTFSIVCFVLPEWFPHWNKACFAKHRPRNSLPWAATCLLHVHGRKKSSVERTTTLTIVRTWYRSDSRTGPTSTTLISLPKASWLQATTTTRHC